MPYTKKYKKKTYRKKKFMPKGLASKRYQGVSTKTFYFRQSGSINSDLLGNTRIAWPSQYVPVAPGLPVSIPEIADSVKVSTIYTEYKVLAVKLRLFAANIGTEPGQIEIGAPDREGFDRGDACIWLDQAALRSETYNPNIVNVINKGSARMIPTRAFKYTKTMYRKQGVPGWGMCDPNVPTADRVPDPWLGSIVLIGNNARTGVGVRPLWFYTITYKIIFRGRNFEP